jgi:hypothetical protein
MACQQQQEEHQEEALCCDNERPPSSLWNLVSMEIDSEHNHDDCQTLPSLKLKVKEKPHQSVSFQSSSSLFCYNIPDDEPREWYTDEDEEIVKAEARKEVGVLRRMKAGASGQSARNPQPHHHQNMCIVGLERQLISREFRKKRARTKKLVNYAVLRKQSKIGTGHGNSNNKVERIAEAARRYSEWSVINAKMFGDFQYIQSKE